MYWLPFLPLLRKVKKFHRIVFFFDNCFRLDDVICHRISHENAKVKRIRSDGFCAMNAVIDNMKSKQFAVIPRIDQMILKLRQELLSNLVFYGKWVDEKGDILLQFDNYVYNRVYNQNLVDIVLLLISNAYKIKINVYVSQGDHYISYRLRKIVPREGRRGDEIDLLKTTDHFESLLPKSKYINTFTFRKCEKL